MCPAGCLGQQKHQEKEQNHFLFVLQSQVVLKELKEWFKKAECSCNITIAVVAFLAQIEFRLKVQALQHRITTSQ